MRLEKSVSKMGLRSLRCWTNDYFIKKHWNFDEIFDFPGCGFSKFSKISIFGLLTIVCYTVFCGYFHCGNEELIRRSKWWFMTKLHFFIKNEFLIIIFLTSESIFGPDRIFFLDRTGPNFSDRLDFWTGPARTGPVHSCNYNSDPATTTLIVKMRHRK